MNHLLVAEIFPEGVPIVSILIGIGVLTFFLLGRYYDTQRRKAIEEWGRSHQLIFSDKQDPQFSNRYPEFDFLKKGENYYAYNTLTGQWNGRPFLGFDYHYETKSSNGKGQTQTQNHYFSGVILQPDFFLNPLSIRPEGFFDKITEFLGYDDIDFESAEFSRKFYVKSTDKRWAYDVIHPRMMEFLITAPRFNIQFGCKYIIAYKESKFSIADYEAAAHLLSGMLDRFPPYLIQQQKEGLPDERSA